MDIIYFTMCPKIQKCVSTYVKIFIQYFSPNDKTNKKIMSSIVYTINILFFTLPFVISCNVLFFPLQENGLDFHYWMHLINFFLPNCLIIGKLLYAYLFLMSILIVGANVVGMLFISMHFRFQLEILLSDISNIALKFNVDKKLCLYNKKYQELVMSDLKKCISHYCLIKTYKSELNKLLKPFMLPATFVCIFGFICVAVSICSVIFIINNN